MKTAGEYRLEDSIQALARNDPKKEASLRRAIQAARVPADDPAALLVALSVAVDLSTRDFSAICDQHRASIQAGITDLPVVLGRQIGESAAVATRAELKNAMPDLLKMVQWSVMKDLLVMAAAVIIITAGLASITGYIIGRLQTDRLAEEYASLAGSENGEFWLNLAALNPSLAAHCKPEGPHYMSLDQGKACRIGVWLSHDTQSTSPSTLQKILRHLADLSTRWWNLPLGFTIGLLLALAIATRSKAQRE